MRFYMVYQDRNSKDLVGVDRGGLVYEQGDWTTLERQIVQSLARDKDIDLFNMGDNWLLTEWIDNDDHDGNLSGGEDPGDQETDEQGQGNDQGQGDDQGDQGEGDQGDQGDQEGDDEGDSNGMDSEQGDEGDEGEEPSLEVQFGEGDGEDPQEGDPFVDDIWPKIKPAVEAIAENRARQGAEQAFATGVHYTNLKAGSGGSSSGGGRTIKVSGVKTGEVKGMTHFVFDKVLRAVARGCHVYLPGPPGTGKSHMALQVAESLGKDFSVTSFSPMSTESKLSGFRDAHGGTVRTEYRERFEGGGIWLGDELDNANPAIVAGLNSGLANSFMEFPDGTIKRHEDFVCIATANTLGTGPTAEFSGRQKLDPATLNRFVKIFVGTDEAMETALVEQILSPKETERWLSKVRHVRRAVETHRIKHFVTMRDSLQGARLIAPGDGKFTITEALEMTVLAVLTEDQRAKIKGT